MAGERFYTRIPPASTGERVGLMHSAVVPYINKTGAFEINQMVTLSTSGFVMHIHNIQELTGTTGYLYVHYDKAATFQNLSPSVGENILDSSGSILAQVTTGTQDLYYNETLIVSKDNPSYGLKIDQEGSANMRFSEGVPQLDAFGKLRVSGSHLLGEYIFANGILEDMISTVEVGAAETSWDSTIRSLRLLTTSANGDIARATTNVYHHYFPGSSHLFLCTLALSDTGKANVKRSWGMFDQDNGVYFCLNGTSFGACIRSDVTGSVTETNIPRTEWNVDKLDGTGPSRMNIDLSKDNLFFIDTQWLGAGRVRFGVFHNGGRWVCHEYNHDNTQPYPYTATMSLPVAFEQKNTAGTGSSSEMRVFCSAVWTETDVGSISRYGRPRVTTITKVLDVENDVPTYIGALAPAEYHSNGKPNRTIYFPSELELLAWDANTGASTPVRIDIISSPLLSGASFSPATELVLLDTSATYYPHTIPIFSSITPGHEHIDLTNTFDNIYSASIKNFADNGGTWDNTISTFSNASPATISTPTPWSFKEGKPLTIKNCAGMTEANGQTVYLKITGATTGELYTNAALTTPFNTTTYGDYVNSSGKLSGYYGTQYFFGILLTKLFGTNPAKVIAKVAWKEIVQ